MKKLIYAAFVLLNVLFMVSPSAQAMWCYPNYKIDSIAYNPAAPYTSGTQVTMVRDSFSVAIPLGFTFTYYGKDFDSVLISPNGYISFNTSMAGRRSATSLSLVSNIPTNTPNAHNGVFLFMQDLEPEAKGAIRYSTIGSAPSRQFVVSYDSVRIKSNYSVDTPYVYCTGQVVLFETSDIIEMHILWTKRSQYASTNPLVQGLENGDAKVAAPVPTRNPLATNKIIQYDGRRFTQQNFSFPTTNPICMVSVDSATQKNIITWNKTMVAPVDSFIVYRETVSAGVYARIGAQPYSTMSTFIDAASVPAQQANRYKICFRDSCGMESVLSSAHKTVHLNINQGSGTTWNLIWDAYEGFSFSSFNIYRGTTPANMTLLTTIASTLYSYTDLTPPLGTVYYMIEVVNPNPCTPSVANGDLMPESSASSYSNIVMGYPVGIHKLPELSIKYIYPNPSNGKFTLAFNETLHDGVVKIFNILGEEVHSQTVNGAQAIVNSKLNAAIYFVEVREGARQCVQKITVE